MNYLYGSIAIVLVLLGVEQYGEHRIQIDWNMETARLESIAKQEKENNRKSLDAIAEQHKKDIENAKSKAGRDAVRDYLSGLLQHQGNNSEAENTSGVSGATCQCGISVEAEEFANRCGQDALKLLRVSEWAQREGLETE